MSQPPPSRRIEDLFIHAAELEPEARRMWLEQERATNPEEVAQIEQLLAADAGLNHSPFVHLLPGFADPPIDAAHRARIVRVGAYRIEASIGHGGMGDVYRGVHNHTGRLAAIKLLRASLTAGRAYDRFRTEAETLARLSDPGIAQLFDAGLAEIELADGRREHRPFLAMEFIDGHTVTEEAELKALPVSDRLRLIHGAVRAVQHAHLRGVIHRDLKPSNILVTSGGAAKVVDFGIAKLLDATGDLTITGQILGTARYMSPEQAMGDHAAVDARSDIYSLGAVLYELLAGRPVVETDSASAIAAVSRVLNQRPVRLAALRPEFRGNVDAVVHKAIEREPAARYQSAGELADDLQRLLSGDAVSARAPTTIERAIREARRNKPLTGAILVAVLAMISGTTVSMWQASQARALAVEASLQTSRANQEAQRAVQATQEAQAQARLAEQQAERATEQWNQVVNARVSWERVREQFLMIFASAASEGGPVRESLTRVLDAQLGARDQPPESESIEQVFGFDVLSEFHAALGDLPAALAWRERSLAVLERQNHPEDALHLMERARVAHLRFQIDPAAHQVESERVLRVCREKLSEELRASEPDSLGIARTHAEILAAMGKIDEAEDILLQQISILESERKPRQLFDFRVALGALYRNANRPSEAASMLTLALKDGVEWGLPASEQASLHVSIGIAHARSGNLDLARESYRQVYNLRTRLFGAEDCRTLDPLVSIARTYFEQGKPDETYDLLRPSLDGLRRCPSLSTQFVRALNTVAEVELGRSDPDAAEPRVAEAIRLAKTGSLESNYLYGWTHLNQARLIRARGDASAAVSLLHELHATLSRLPNSPSGVLSQIALELANLHESLGRASDAAAWRRRAGR